MKKVSTAATKQSRNISRQRLTIGLDREIATVGTACWMKWGRYNWSSVCERLRKRCAKFSARCQQPDRTGDRDAFALDQSLVEPVGP
jgi:hypothetical protein